FDFLFREILPNFLHTASTISSLFFPYLYIAFFSFFLRLQDPMETIIYWLSSVRSRAVKKVPVVLVGTHLDEIKGFDPNVHFPRLSEHFNSRNILARFSNIVPGLYLVSCKTGENVQLLTQVTFLLHIQ